MNGRFFPKRESNVNDTGPALPDRYVPTCAGGDGAASIT
jgi:hypothetical protein